MKHKKSIFSSISSILFIALILLRCINGTENMHEHSPSVSFLRALPFLLISISLFCFPRTKFPAYAFGSCAVLFLVDIIFQSKIEVIIDVTEYWDATGFLYKYIINTDDVTWFFYIVYGVHFLGYGVLAFCVLAQTSKRSNRFGSIANKISFVPAILIVISQVVLLIFNIKYHSYISGIRGYLFRRKYGLIELHAGDICAGVLEILALVAVGVWVILKPTKEEEQPSKLELMIKRRKEHSSDSVSPEEKPVHINLFSHVLLLLFTCGIWMYIWIYRITRYLNCVEDEEYRDPVKKLLLCIFVPFYSIYWTYKSSQRIDKLAAANGVSSDLSTLCLIMAIFLGIIPPILMQEKINSIAVKSDKEHNQSISASPTVQSNAAQLKEYKELLDEGIITQEEFDAKKKQLLGL